MGSILNHHKTKNRRSPCRSLCSITGKSGDFKEYSGEKVIYELKRTQHRCPKCGSKDVFAERMGERSIRGVPMGVCREVYLRYTMHRIYCYHCHERSMEHVPFLSHPKARLTKPFERTILELRQHMSIRAVSNYFHLRWWHNWETSLMLFLRWQVLRFPAWALLRTGALNGSGAPMIRRPPRLFFLIL